MASQTAGGTQQKRNEGIAAYVGISAPETPRYLLTNNFLADYFETSREEEVYDFDTFLERGVLYTEDEANRELLKASFDLFLKRYLGEEAIREENRKLTENKHFYFPLIPEMLTDSTANLRHVLYRLQMLDQKFDYDAMQKKLDHYMFADVSGLNYILKILFQGKEHRTRYKSAEKWETTEEYWSMLDKAERGRMLRLGQRLSGDLDTLLTHPYFLQLDFYRRYHYLSMLLTSYVIQYIVVRKDGTTGILCKGNPLDSRLGGMLHRACCNNYDNIRNLFPSLLQDCYEQMTRKLVTGEEKQLHIVGKDGNVKVNGKPFQDFTADVTGRKVSNHIAYDKLIQAFELEEGKEKTVSVENFVLRYIDLTKTRRGSTLTKLSSTLTTSGKQIGMIYPRSNVRQKYFAMLENLAEFYVRLYLARQGRQYDYLEHFLADLQERYRIVIAKSPEGDKRLKAVKPRLSAQDFARNQAAFIDTLNSVNCLIKLSDSGYVVTLPEMKGDFRLI